MFTKRSALSGLFQAIGFTICALASSNQTGAAAANDVFQVANKQMLLTVQSSDGSYEIRARGANTFTLRAVVAAQIDHSWIEAGDYPHHDISESSFQDLLGHGRQLSVQFSGLRHRPDLAYVLRLYDALPFGDIQVEVQNRSDAECHVERIRVLEAQSAPAIDLGGNESSDRVLSDSFGENRPLLQIYDLGQGPQGLHRGVGSQLIFNRDSQQSLFVGALTTERFLTIASLETSRGANGAHVSSFRVESTGTTELQSRSIFPDAPAEEDRIELSLPVGRGNNLQSERVMLAVGNDYHAQLDAYGAAIRELHHARVDSANLLGWWSWTALYRDITDQTILTNAQWLSQHLQKLGYNYFHIDSGYEYAPGEYATPNASRFPQGVRPVTQAINRMGLKLAIWTAPFYVGTDSRVWQYHKNWLVHNARGAPIRIMKKARAQEGQDIYVIDTTNPAAQDYLRQTYYTFVREWGVRYIKLDFMDSSSIEGFRFRPNTTALEAQRIGLQVIRDAVGEDVLLDKDASDMLNAVGFVDEGRISQDTAHSFADTRAAAPAIAARYYMHRNFYVSDPDAFNVSRQTNKKGITRPMTLDEARVSIVLAAISGGMFEIGDDLPTLGADPERLALVTNPELLKIAFLSRAFRPLDLMTYRSDDEMPNTFLLRESRRQSVLAVFNWTEHSSSHDFEIAELGLSAGSYKLYDALNGNKEISFDGRAIHITEQSPHSVELIRVVDETQAPQPPIIEVQAPSAGKVREDLHFSASTPKDETPALAYHWDFGDGISADGPVQNHTYTLAGRYLVNLLVDGIDEVSTTRSLFIAVEGLQPIAPPQRYEEAGARLPLR